MFREGDRVSTPSGFGSVVYRRMAPPDYSQVAAYSVCLDGKEGERGTVFGADKVSAAPADAPKPAERFAPVPLAFEGPATIYRRGEMGFAYHRIEARRVSVTAKKYAQYARALEIVFTPKGARKARYFVEDYRPELLILRGWGHPVPPNPFRDLGGGMSVTRATSHDEHWGLEFQTMIAPVLEADAGLLLGDYRGFDTKAGL